MLMAVSYCLFRELKSTID